MASKHGSMEIEEEMAMDRIITSAMGTPTGSRRRWAPPLNRRSDRMGAVSERWMLYKKSKSREGDKTVDDVLRHNGYETGCGRIF
jgi:hypothetical protein